ncbi:MAG: pyrroline-5-carboxylate reductase [Alphaproteobacteria bacterium]|nr:pyrroline-5-carboxylate reductase [Alphaproteobacteria bacterium SS10]
MAADSKTAEIETPINLLQIGCGKMGGALLDAWIAADLLNLSYIVDPGAERLDLPGHVPLVSSLDEVPETFEPDILMLAIKPQMVADAMSAIVPRRHNAAVLSIMAGVTIDGLAGHLGKDTPIIRTMPNTPAAVRKGITAAFANDHVGSRHRSMVDRLLDAAGTGVWLEDETQFDAVTGVAGSGPAYVFHMVEALAAAGEANGLAPDLAMELARAAVSGAGALMETDEASAATLRKNVTSPKGTTEAGLKVLMGDDGLTKLVTETVTAAANRSRELGG